MNDISCSNQPPKCAESGLTDNSKWQRAIIVGHKSQSMTRLYTGEIPLNDVAAACSKAFGTELEILETEAAA